jgi:hypothetical protein
MNSMISHRHLEMHIAGLLRHVQTNLCDLNVRVGRACAHLGVAPPGVIPLNIVFVIFRVCHGGALERDQGNLPQFASRDGGIRGHNTAPKPHTLQNVC